ncbi:putative phosphoesterase [Mariniflexile fucanivorans]|uniref:Putative phosphoesterase n=1 Tax=Mariniflexile fucanivorans TaxID=264023 RepID=A0A4R1RMI5_9FLAO|nr:ligase-associated DNA damage response endonuclease PdeM [Mariniflexile fucanivorans]TCL67493.1 putative phosphoesterase [Mariniflexile fucanivorans]
MTIKIQNQTFILHHFGAIFWQEKSILLVSDVHFGKVSHFRKHGIAIPMEAILENFKRMDTLINDFKPQTIIFLGDLFHSTINNEWDLFMNWAKTVPQEIILVKGNHDILTDNHFEEIDIKVVPKLVIDSFILTHHPLEVSTLYNFCGHIHPGIKLKAKGKQFLNIPCFFRKPNQMILPAFGEFTGNFYLKPTNKDLVYGITPEKVIEITLQ